MNIKKYFSIPLIMIFSLLIVTNIKPAQGPGKKTSSSSSSDDQGGNMAQQDVLDALKQQYEKEKDDLAQQMSRQHKLDIDELANKLNTDKEEQANKLKEDLKKAKDKKEKYKSRGQAFHTQNAAPMAGTETDHAQAQYWGQQAHHQELKDRYQTPMAIVSALNRDYIAPVALPVVLEARQGIYQTEHEKHQERMEKLNEKVAKANKANHKVTKLSTDLNNMVYYCNNIPKRHDDKHQLTPEGADCKRWGQTFHEIMELDSQKRLEKAQAKKNKRSATKKAS